MSKTTKIHRDEKAAPVGEPICCQPMVHIKENSSAMAINEFDHKIALEAYVNEICSKPYPPYRQRVKGALRVRLEQLCIKAELKEAKDKQQEPGERVNEGKRGNNLPMSKCNKSRVSASIASARRLMILIRSHLWKKGLG